MKKLLFFAILIMACVGFQSCMMDNSEPMVNVKTESQSRIIFLKSSSCSRSAAAERYFQKVAQSSGLDLKKFVYFIELDENAENFDKGRAMEYFKSAKYYYNLGSDVNTPVICFGENYISGWDYRDEVKVDAWVKPYMEKAEQAKW